MTFAPSAPHRRRFLLAGTGLAAGVVLAAPARAFPFNAAPFATHTAAALAGLPAAATGASAGGANPAMSEETHLLSRLAFGPSTADRERLRALGTDGWIDEQLRPDKLALPADLQRELDALPTQTLSQHELLMRYREAQYAGKTDEGKARRHFLMGSVAQEDAQARLLRATRSPRQLEEVLTEFWFNHFNVFADKGPIKMLSGHYERTAIRPHVLGRFRDMLGATARHPAMLFYLDNWLSVAPGMQVSAGRTGLNENYARELMELHTLGVDGGYTQKDVTELARMLTGWTYRADRTTPSVFEFVAKQHDNGSKTWLGQTIEPAGEAEGEHALDVLARHPSTAKRIGFKLAQCFVADAPPPALVERLARRFLDTDGDLREVTRALVTSAEFRAPEVRGAKFKTPYRQVVTAARVSGLAITDTLPLRATLTQMAQPLYGCPTPDGWKDTEEAWLSPEAIGRRVNFASTLASGRLPIDTPFRLMPEPDAPDPKAGARAADMAPATMGEMKPPMPAMPAPGRAQAAVIRRDAAALADADAGTRARRPEPLDAERLLAALGDAITPRVRAAVADARPELRAALVLGSPDFMRH
ncbi:DUF1800 domain-containing protein [Derxia gummosa]|uniref:DUF1800 domain-containing protein n=1 Tax=Derxia gummosa DSM 723 TaxID=1121388 RepID=A0A8B6XA33_9BURK|nr:DUF1800 domain-containing protein [Derxia gummosa]